MNFKTHKGDVITGKQYQAALDKVAHDWESLGHRIYQADEYAAHVTQETKLARLQDHIDCAADIRVGNWKSFTIWQRINTALTGECVAFLPS